MTNYRLGMFDENAYTHGMDVVKDMRDATGKIRGDTHFVVVAVYADGYLQLAGADATLNIPIDRLMTKQVAQMILGRMESHGEIDTEESSAKFASNVAASAGNAAAMRETLEIVIRLANEQYQIEGDYGGKVEALLRITELCATAIAEPSRNCDRSGCKDYDSASKVFKNETPGAEVMYGSEFHHKMCYWLLEAATEGGAS